MHDDNDLAKVDKFKHLRSYLEEPAKSFVTGFALTHANYDEAVELLFKRYAKPGFIKKVYMNKLLFLDPVFKETSVERLRAVRDQIETHFRALEAQGVDKDSYSTVVVPAVMEKNSTINQIQHDSVFWKRSHGMERWGLVGITGKGARSTGRACADHEESTATRK